MAQPQRKTDSQEAARAQILRWRAGGPALFAVEALGVPKEWDPETKEGVLPWQWEASRLLVSKKRLSVRSGKGIGKSAFLAWSILWMMTCYMPVRIGCTAPTSTQMEDVLWAELSIWHNRLKVASPALGAQFEWKVDSFVLAESPKMSFAVARTARPEKPEALQGLHAHGGAIMVIADEASGVDDKIFEAGKGALADDNSFVILASNPTRLSGLFFETHNKLKPLWGTLRVNGEEVPLQSQRLRDDIIYQYGKDSNYYRVNVTGEFPTSEDDVVIPADLCLAATRREVRPFGGRVWGVDVARFGSDRTVLVKRSENATLEKHKSWSGQDTMQTTGKILNEWRATPPDERPHAIMVDVIGIGAGVCDRLQELDMPAIGINVAESASTEDRFLRMRDELWFKAREWLEQKHCKLAEDDVLLAELSLPLYAFTSNGKIKVESKDEMRRRHPRSPDVADAFCLTFAMAAQFKGRPTYEPEVYADGA